MNGLNPFKLVLSAVILIAGIAHSQTSIFSHTGSVQFYTVPATVTTLHVECFGAQGGDGFDAANSPGGLGARIDGYVTVTPGEQLVIVVGGAGGDAGSFGFGGGGGGGSFVIRDAGYIPLVIASGGGGGSYETGAPGENGSTTNAAGGGAYTPASIGEGGITADVSGHGSGGGGWNSSGMSNQWGNGGEIQGGVGGNSQNADLDGGFGGGGAGFQGGGGGGGYTGGGGGDWVTGGGGGGSYNTGFNQLNSQSPLSGDGLVKVTPDCVPLSTSPASQIEVCEGAMVTLTGSSSTGGITSWDNGVVDGQAFEPPVGTNIYTISSTSASDCGHSITVEVHAAPVLGIEGAPGMVCFGLEQVNLIGSGAHVLTWSGGIQSNVPFDPPLGASTYILTGTDTTTGCVSMITYEVFASDPTINGSSVIGEINGNDGSITINVDNGLPPITYDWDNDGTGDFDDPQNLTSIPGGTYTVTVMDSIGCTVSATYTVDSQLTVLDNDLPDFNIYPNPAQDVLNLNSPEVFSLEIKDARGRSIMINQGQNAYQIDVSDFELGVYFAYLKTGNAEHVVKFVKH